MRGLNKKKILGAFLGTIVEYYDYSLYGFSAAIIATKFFPENNHINNLKYAFAVYAISYLAKPLGAILFSYIGDYYGRKVALNSTILGISLPTIIIGLLPEYAEIGVISTVVLLLCRFLQGIFVAGEYDGAAIYVMEHLGLKNQAMASAITRATGVLGLLFGIGMSNFFSAQIFPDWAWRLPFLFSLPLALFTLYFRKKLIETPEFIEFKCKKNKKTTEAKLSIKNYFLTIVGAIFLAGSFGATYQVAIILMKQYLPMVMPATKVIMTSFSVLIIFCFGIFMPISGYLALKFSEMKVIKVGFIFTIISCILIIISIEYQIVNLVLFSTLLLAASVSPFNALGHSIIVKFFPTQIRYRAVSISHTIGSMLMSGTANYVCLSIIDKYELPLFPIMYIMFFSLMLYLVVIGFEYLIRAQHITLAQNTKVVEVANI